MASLLRVEGADRILARMKLRRCFPLAALAAFACSEPAAPVYAEAPSAGWKVSITATPFRLAQFAEDENLSGLASWDGKQFLVVTDEGTNALPGTLDPATGLLSASGAVPLPAQKEADAEGVCASREESCYYITGSHGVGKKKADFQPERALVYRVPVDAANGAPKAEGVLSTDRLFQWAEKHPVLKDYVRKPLQLNGFNIEGLCARDGKLWFGVRGPNLNGTIHVIETTGASLFGTGELQATLHSLQTGTDGIGVRELAALKEGLLILTGNASAEASKQQPKTMARDPNGDSRFELWLWSPGQDVKRVGLVPNFPGKAEGLYVMEDTGTHAEVVILHDSEPQGGAKVIRLEKKSQ